MSDARATVATYLRLVETAHNAATVEREGGLVPDQERLAREQERLSVARATWAALREARIFHVPQAVERALYHVADRMVEAEAGLKWQPFNPLKPAPPHEVDAYRKTCERLISETPYPERLPFPTMFVGFGHGSPLDEIQLMTLYLESSIPPPSRLYAVPGSEKMPDGAVVGFLLGYTLAPNVLGAGPAVFEHIQPHQDKTGPSTILRYARGEWLGAMTLAPFVVNRLVETLYEHRAVLVDPNATDRYDFHRTSRKLKIPRFIPRPYYVLNVDDKVVLDEESRRGKKLGRYSFAFTHRFDVASHERVRVAYGPLPIEEKVRKKLAKRRYTVYERMDAIPVGVEKKLLLRGLRLPQDAEWIAVLTSTIREHQRGPKDAPYVPAVRNLGRKRARRANEEAA